MRGQGSLQEDALERLEAREYAGRGNAAALGNLAQASPRMWAKGAEDRAALQSVLSALNCDISIEALERAVATVKAHLEAVA